MADKKIYTIQINGISESTNAVEALNKQLEALEARIKTLEKSNVKVGTSGGSTKTSTDTSSMDETISKQKEINKLKKEELAAQKAIEAQQRLTANEYDNTMKGMKQNLADLKTVMNVTDLGDTDKIKEMTKDAGALTQKLKDMEQAYGQYGRNVGNYANGVAEGLQKVKVTVGDSVREFDNAKQASKTLGNELKTMAVNGQQDTKAFQDLQQAVAQLNSDIKDATVSSKAMDDLLDTMQSFAAIGTISTGFASLFGFDDAEVEQSIKKMVAFQNALKGIESINKQIQSREGVGKWIAPFTTQIDKATTKLLAFNTALLGTGKAANVASKGIKLMSVALKGLLSLGIIAVISIIIEKVMDLIESFNKLSDAEQLQKDVEEAMADAYGKGMAKLTQYKARLDSFNGSKKEEKKLVEELNKEFGETLGTYKTIAEWQDVLNKKGQAYIETLKLQAKAQAALNAVTAAYANLMKVQMGIANGEYDGILNSIFGKSGEARLVEAQKLVDDTSKMLEDVTKEQEKFNKENKLGDYAPQIEKNTRKTKNAMEEAQRTLNQLELRLMNDGLNKKLRQLDEEERQTINKLRENGRKNENEIKKIQRAYAALRAKEIQNYLNSLDDKIKKSADEIKKIQFEINTKEIENQVNELKNEFDELSQYVPAINTLTSRVDIKSIVGDEPIMKIWEANRYIDAKEMAEQGIDELDEYYTILKKFLQEKKAELGEEFSLRQLEDGEEIAFDWLSEKYEEEYSKALNIVKSYGRDIVDIVRYDLAAEDAILSNSFENRANATAEYYDYTLKQLKENIEEQGKLNEERINQQYEQDYEAERERYRLQYNSMLKQKETLDEEIKNFKANNKEEEKALEELNRERDELQKQMETALQQHGERQAQITEDKNNKIKKNEFDTLKEIQSAYEKYFNQQLSNYRDMQSKLNTEISKNPVTSKGWGIVNIPQTKKNYKEIIEASKTAIKEIQYDKAKLEKDFKNGLISEDAYNSTKNNLNDLESEIKNGIEVIEEASKNLVANFVQSIQGYLQAVTDSFNTIMNALWDAEDNAFDKEQEALDKQNEELDKKLDEQQEIVEKHKDAIDSIEEELATARGDRRQHLIDQLNAEMEAERAAAKEKKKIEKEQEAAQKKQDELELKRKKAQYKRDMLQAIVNGAMAVTMAAVNSWPIPAIPMMALAATTTAAQIAIMASNKPYANGGVLDGGVAQGKRHSEGGIPVLGGRASIEGGEFITNRKTTASNVELLDFINAKHRRLNIDDFIEFYSSGKAKKSIISMSPRTKFADGGVVPTLNNEYSFDDRLLSAFEDYSNRPVVVSVVDINNKQDDVRRVQTLAGL